MLQRLGGASMHRAGIAAAAALVALDGWEERVAGDNRRARLLADRLAAVEGIVLDPTSVETNIVLVDVTGTGLVPETLVPLIAEAGVRVFERDTARIRLVTHREVGDAEVEEAARIVADVVERHAAPPVELPEIDDAWEAELETSADD